jgi:hypothetical protein
MINLNKLSCIHHGPDTHPSALLFAGRGGDLLYQCFHHGDLTLTLPQVRASIAYGEVTRLKDQQHRSQAVEHMVWRLRLLNEAGALKPSAVPHQALTEEVKPAVRAVYEGCLLLLGLKWHLWPENGTTFSWRFAAAWCGVTKWAAEDAMKWLMNAGYVHSVGKSRSAYGKEAHVLMAKVTKRDYTLIDLDSEYADWIEVVPDADLYGEEEE